MGREVALKRTVRASWLGAAVVMVGTAVLLFAMAPEFSQDRAGITLRQMFVILAAIAAVMTGRVLSGQDGEQVLQEWRAAAANPAFSTMAGFVAVGAQVWLLTEITRRFLLENSAFHEKLMPLVLFGFVVHHLVPLRARLPFFVALSAAGIQLVFGTANGAWLIALGLLLIGICHLPLRFGARVALLVAVGAALAALRAGVTETPWSSAIWPILGSMFMFRLIAYMYDLRHLKQPVRPAQTLAYFFLLPNLAFPLFPVVDHATFKRTYYDQDAIRIYQRGIRWMVIGCTHLLIYRLVYHNLTVSPVEITTPFALSRHILTNFMLYLRVSGQFHMIVGILHLFGFRLPESHRFFFLASSFTDFWRRINVYWKDFMMKVVYYPTYFRVRQLRDSYALVISTLTVFVLTWALHSYQWFWLLGSLLLSWTDVTFWAILAVLLTVTAVRELRRGRQRSLGEQRRTMKQWLHTGAMTTATFTTICILWSLWSSHSLEEWFGLWTGAGFSLVNVATVVGLVATGGALLFTVLTVGPRVVALMTPRLAPATHWLAPATATAVWALALFVLADHQASARVLPPSAQRVARDLRIAQLNRQDAAMLRQGYYESLNSVGRFNSQLWEIYAQRPTDWPSVDDAGLTRSTGDFLAREFKPNLAAAFHGARFTTNQWGMRDRRYELAAPAGTRRIALLGQSYVMGSGVDDRQVFENLVEDRLNLEHGSGEKRYEILNFGIPTTPAQQVYRLERKALRFKPDIAFYVAFPDERGQLLHHTAGVFRDGVELPYSFMNDVLGRAGVNRTMSREAIMRALVPYERELLLTLYQRFVETCRQHGVIPAWFIVSTPDVSVPTDSPVTQLAREAGFVVLDLGNVYKDREPISLFVAPWDHHPNAEGHVLIADGLFQAIVEHPQLLGR